jgi:hypothetical protein
MRPCSRRECGGWALDRPFHEAANRSWAVSRAPLSPTPRTLPKRIALVIAILVDLAAEIHDTRERVGYAYTWTMVMSGDDYMASAFADLYTDYGGGVLRLTGGDNRRLRTWDPEASP